VPLVAVGIAGLLLASAVGVAVVGGENEDEVSTDATTTSSFPPFEEETTTTSLAVDPNATVVTEVPAAPVSVAPVPAPDSASTTSSVTTPAAPAVTLATGPAPCEVPAAQPATGAPLGPAGAFTVVVADGQARVANSIGRMPAWRPKTNQVVSVAIASGKPPGLCLSASDGAGAKAITTPVGIGSPALSSDGGRVAVRSARSGGSDLVAFSVEAADQKVLLQASEMGDPVWLGNGSAVVVCALISGTRRIVAVPAGGGDARPLRDGCPPGPMSASPDGTRIAFTQKNQVIVVNATTRAASTLTIGTSVSTATAPTWSPDSKRLAFSFNDAQGASLGIFDVEKGSGSSTFRNPALLAPAWAPAGDLIAFVGTEGAGQSLIVVKPDGTGRRAVATCQTRCTLGTQAWSSDGKSIAVELSGSAA
jgi:Tol biopolymer transport system component